MNTIINTIWLKLKPILLNPAVIFALIALIFFLLFLQQCKKNISNKDNIKKYEQTIIALNDSIKRVITKDGDTVYIERTVSYNLDDVLNSSAYKQLDKEKQQFYKDLKKVKGLLASAQIDLESKDSIIEVQRYNLNAHITDSMICFDKGSSLSFEKPAGNLTYTEELYLGDSLKRTFNYGYKVNIQSTYTKEKDGSVIITHKLDDPNAKITDGQSYIIPAATEKQESKFKKFMRKTGNYILIGAAFVGGIYLGAL